MEATFSRMAATVASPTHMAKQVTASLQVAVAVAARQPTEVTQCNQATSLLVSAATEVKALQTIGAPIQMSYTAQVAVVKAEQSKALVEQMQELRVGQTLLVVLALMQSIQLVLAEVADTDKAEGAQETAGRELSSSNLFFLLRHRTRMHQRLAVPLKLAKHSQPQREHGLQYPPLLIHISGNAHQL